MGREREREKNYCEVQMQERTEGDRVVVMERNGWVQFDINEKISGVPTIIKY